jgi:tetratricopeptide (TPR) repeat protein
MSGSNSILFAVLGIAVVLGFWFNPIVGAIALVITAVFYYRNLQPIFANFSRRQASSSVLFDLSGEEIDPVTSHCNRGKFRYQTGNEELAIADFNRAIELDPEIIEAYYYRGLARHNLGDIFGAKEDLQQAAMLADRQSHLQLYEQISAHLRALNTEDSKELN